LIFRLIYYLTNQPLTIINLDLFRIFYATTGLSQDRLALDGQRLVCVSGTYGSPGSEYRTEIESFKRIKAHGSGTITGFSVESKDGLIYHYGKLSSIAPDIGDASDVAHIKARNVASNQDVTVVWALRMISDRHGNYILYDYGQVLESGLKTTEYYIKARE